MNKKNRYYRLSGFTIVEVTSTMIISSIIFLGLFTVFIELNKVFTNFMLKNEINQYCENVLDRIATNMANAEFIESRIYNNNIAITTINENMAYNNSFYLDNYSGIMQNNIPIHVHKIADIFDNIDGQNENEAQYSIRFNPFKKDGTINYILDSWEIKPLNEYEEYQDVYNIEPVTPLSTLVNSLTYMIKINVKLVAGGNEDFPKEYLIFSRSVFCPNAQAYGMDLLNVL